MNKHFRYFKSSPDIIRLAVMMYIRFPLSLRNVEDILHERGIDISYETIRFWWNRFGPLFAKEIKKKRTGSHSNWRWHIDEVFVITFGVLSTMKVRFLMPSSPRKEIRNRHDWKTRDGSVDEQSRRKCHLVY
jgi:hypothetical protein